MSQNAEKLLQKAKPTVFGCGFHRKEDILRNLSWQIDRTSISFPNSSKFLEKNISGWIKLVLSQHQINVQYAEANCSLTRMNLYRSGSRYIRHCHLKQEIGTLLFLYIFFVFTFVLILLLYLNIRAFWYHHPANSCGKWPWRWWIASWITNDPK